MLLNIWKYPFAALVAALGIFGITSSVHAQKLYFEEKHVGPDGLTYYKYMDETGAIRGGVHDAKGRAISPNELVQERADIVAERLAVLLDDDSTDDTITVRLALREQDDAGDTMLEQEFGEVIASNGNSSLKINGVTKSIQE